MKKFILISLLTISCISAQEYIYFDGNEKRTIYLKPDLLAEFSISQNHKSYIRQIDPGSKEIKKLGIVTVHQIKNQNIKNQIQKLTFTKNLTSSQKISEVFTPNTNGNPLMALPGQIIITFKRNITEDQKLKFLQDKNLKLVRKTTLLEKDYYIVQYRPGIACLEYANFLKTLPEIETSTPDFWIEVSKK